MPTDSIVFPVLSIRSEGNGWHLLPRDRPSARSAPSGNLLLQLFVVFSLSKNKLFCIGFKRGHNRFPETGWKRKRKNAHTVCSSVRVSTTRKFCSLFVFVNSRFFQPANSTIDVPNCVCPSQEEQVNICFANYRYQNNHSLWPKMAKIGNEGLTAL